MDVQQIRAEVSQLPRGYISHKRIRGKIYPYHQWSCGGKKQSRYVPPEELAELEAQLARRRELEAILKGCGKVSSKLLNLTGQALRETVHGSGELKKRDVYGDLQSFLSDSSLDRICVLLGLRGSGKSTLMRQALADMPEDSLRRSVYMKIRSQDTMEEVLKSLERFYRRGFRYFFLDDISLLPDFWEKAGAIADYAATGAKLVLTGAESLCFSLAAESSLYNRVIFLHTTPISFREHCRVLGRDSLREYLQWGGFLQPDSPGCQADAAAYTDAAICRNIRCSLEHDRGGLGLRLLTDLWEAGNLDWAIRRGLERVCLEAVPPTQEFREFLSLRELEDWSHGLGPGQLAQIKDYFKTLDLLVPCPTEFMDVPETETLCFTQPGLFRSLARSVLEEPQMLDQRILSDTILLEAQRALEKTCDVFRLQASRSHLDMVIRIRKERQCAVYVIRSDAQEPDFSALTDRALLDFTAHKFGSIVGKCVLYPGETMEGPFGIVFQNAEEFLRGL